MSLLTLGPDTSSSPACDFLITPAYFVVIQLRLGATSGILVDIQVGHLSRFGWMPSYSESQGHMMLCHCKWRLFSFLRSSFPQSHVIYIWRGGGWKAWRGICSNFHDTSRASTDNFVLLLASLWKKGKTTRFFYKETIGFLWGLLARLFFFVGEVP